MATTPGRPIPVALLSAAVLTASLWAQACANPEHDARTDALYQLSTIDALQHGLFQGRKTVADVLRHGDFGLGTFEGLDGEMVVVNGEAWQVPTDGVPRRAAAAQTSPFAAVLFFDVDRTVGVPGSVDTAGLAAALEQGVGDPTVFHAIRIHGTFDHLKLRSVPKQSEPFPPLSEVVAQQTVFERDGLTGTLVGLRSPSSYADGQEATYHWHFLSDDRTAGGHVLDLAGTDLTAEVDDLPLWENELGPNPES